MSTGIANEVQYPLHYVDNVVEVNEERARDLVREPAYDGNVDAVESLAHSLRTNANQVSKQERRADAIVQLTTEHGSVGSGERY